MKPKCYIFEQIPLIERYVARLLIESRKLNMQDFNAMPSMRRRLIGSSMPLHLEKLSSDAYKQRYKSPRRVISETCVKHNTIDVTQVDSFLIMNSYNHISELLE